MGGTVNKALCIYMHCIARFDIIVDSVKHVGHVVVASNCQVSALGPLMVAKEVVMVLGDDCVSQRFWDS